MPVTTAPANAVPPPPQVQRYRAVVQLNDPGKARQEQVLGNLTHLVQAFQVEGISLKLVAHGEGIELLLQGTPRDEGLMRHLHEQGVRLLACGTTLARLGIDRAQLRAGVEVVPSAIAHLI